MICGTGGGFVANTDYDWYEFFLARPEIDEVNFWRPGSANFQALSPGEPLLFRVKAPYNAIAGVGMALIGAVVGVFKQKDESRSRRSIDIPAP